MKKIEVYTHGKVYTIEIPEITDSNSTWFECASNYDVHRITDIDEGLLITPLGDGHTMLVPKKSRADVNFSQAEASRLQEYYY